MAGNLNVVRRPQMVGSELLQHSTLCHSPRWEGSLYNIEPGLGHHPHYNTLLTHALSHCKRRFKIFKRLHGYFLGSPVIRTLHFQCKGLGIGPQSGN